MTNAAFQIPQSPSAAARGEAEPALPHLYVALTECGRHGGGRPMQGTSVAIWQAIDRLRTEPDRAAEIRILEQLSIEIHRLGFVLKRPEVDSEANLRRHISALTDAWLGVARLCA